MCVDVSNYNRREKGQAKISAEEWQKLSKILEVPLEDIFEAEESQVFIFNDQSTGNVNSVVNYTIPLSMWKKKKKYIGILEKEIAEMNRNKWYYRNVEFETRKRNAKTRNCSEKK